MKNRCSGICLLAMLCSASVTTAAAHLISEDLGTVPNLGQKLISPGEPTAIRVLAEETQMNASSGELHVSQTGDFPRATEHKLSDEQLHGVMKVSDLAIEQERFREWLFASTAVTSVHFEGKQLIWVQLSPDKYTSKANVERIATDIARWYARRTGQKSAICTVWRGNQIYAKGRYFGE